MEILSLPFQQMPYLFCFQHRTIDWLCQEKQQKHFLVCIFISFFCSWLVSNWVLFYAVVQSYIFLVFFFFSCFFATSLLCSLFDDDKNKMRFGLRVGYEAIFNQSMAALFLPMCIALTQRHDVIALSDEFTLACYSSFQAGIILASFKFTMKGCVERIRSWSSYPSAKAFRQIQ